MVCRSSTMLPLCTLSQATVQSVFTPALESNRVLAAPRPRDPHCLPSIYSYPMMLSELHPQARHVNPVNSSTLEAEAGGLV